MATEVKLPALGESVTEGTVTQWLKQVGDDVAVDEPLLEVSTDKVDTEIPSPVAGTLLEIRADTDETVEVGAVLAVIGDSDEASSGESDGSGDGDAASADAEPEEGAGEPDESTGDADEGNGGDADESAAGDDESGGDESAGESTDGKDAESDESAAEEPKSGSDGGGSSTEVKLPALGESVTEGTVTQWLKQVGDDVSVDEPLLEVSTDKVDTEIPSPVAGTLLEIKVDTDETVEVGTVLALIGSGSPKSAKSPETDEGSGATDDKAAAESAEAESSDPEEPETSETEAQESESPDERSADSSADSAPAVGAKLPPEQAQATEGKPRSESGQARPTAAPSPVGDGAPAYVTPLVRKLAAQHEVDLASVTGSGVGGRIRKQDVLAAAEANKQTASAAAEPAASDATPAGAPAAAPTEPSPLRGKTEKLSRLRQVIARRMVESLQTSAQLTTVVEVDVTSIARMRAKHKASFEKREGVKLSFLPFFAKAAVDALKIYPQLNASIDTEKNEVTYAPSENLGVAVDTERGLLVATVRDAGDLSIPGLARKIADLAERTRTNKISPDELSGATFTLTNTGSRGALFDTPIIFQPQVAILGTGAVVKRPVVIDDANLGETIAVRQMVYLALTYDHRLVDGADAARFLSAVKQRLEEANFEADLV
jgi:pyruvate dehydrogenase E2 component (dihydrolipoamide acetyltransferase)